RLEISASGVVIRIKSGIAGVKCSGLFSGFEKSFEVGQSKNDDCHSVIFRLGPINQHGQLGRVIAPEFLRDLSQALSRLFLLRFSKLFCPLRTVVSHPHSTDTPPSSPLPPPPTPPPHP